MTDKNNNEPREEGHIDVGDAQIHYRIDGSKGAPWLILSNSLATDYRMWVPQMEALTKTHQVLRYDKRGHGESTAPEPPYSFDVLTSDVIALMDVLSIEKADFVGLSIGGMTGLGLAIAYPERINRLVCCDARAEAPPMFQQMWPANIANAKAGGMSSIATPTMERWFTEPFRSDPINGATLGLVQGMINKTSVDGYEGCATSLMQLDYLKDLGAISCPVLYIGGSHDPAAPVDVMTEMANKTPGARFVEISDAAHLANMENPEAFNQALTDWLNS